MKKFFINLKLQEITTCNSLLFLAVYSERLRELLPHLFAKPLKMGSVEHFLAEDHVRIDDLLQRTIGEQPTIDHDAYKDFGRALLRHIAMEEKVLFPTIQRLRGGTPLPAVAKLRFDHGAIGTLLMPTLTPIIVDSIRTILKAHNALEEGAEGVYGQCEQVSSVEMENLFGACRQAHRYQ